LPVCVPHRGKLERPDQTKGAGARKGGLMH
jgi:hypothetical protein